MKKIILSLDYELFFGDKAGSVEKTLLTPTRKILDALQKVNGCAVFFVDYLMLKRMHAECERTHQEALLIEEQLRDIIRAGSRIELHLHPHWIDAKYCKGEWDFSDFTHYCLNSLPESEITEMFVEGTNHLNAIAQSVIPDYKVNTFRAGGWAILPFSVMKDGFEKSGITTDSSVTKKHWIRGYTYKVDFTNSPEDDIYNFNDDVLQKEPEGKFREVQISTFKFNPFTYVLSSFYRKKHPEKFDSFADGSHLFAKLDMLPENAPLKFSMKERFFLKSTFAINETNKYCFWYYITFSMRPVTVIMGHPKDYNLLTQENILFLGKHFGCCTYENL